MPFIQASGTTGGGAGSISVTDGVTTVNPATIVDFTSGATVSNAGGGQANVAIAAGSFAFSPTAVKTANYTAAASEWVAVDPSGGSFAVTLPAAPANGTIVAVGHAAASGTATVAAGAGDTIGTGLQTTVSTTRRAFIYTYRASDKVWQGVTPLSTAVLTATAFDGSIVTGGTSTAVTFKTGTLDAIATAQPPVAAVALNAQKITGLGLASAATDAASLANTLDQFGAPAANVAFNAKKVTGLAAGSANGDSVRWEQSPAALLTTTGDVIYASGANTPARLAVGATGQVQGVAAGLPAWENPVFGIPLSFRSGRYTGVCGNTADGGGNSLAVGVMYLMTFLVIYTITTAGIGVNVTTNTATSVVRLGLYADGGAGIPTTLLIDAGTVDTHTATGFVEATMVQALTPGAYWVAVVAQTAGPSVELGKALSTCSRSTGAAASAFVVGCYNISGTNGALPNPAGTVADGPGGVPYVSIRI